MRTTMTARTPIRTTGMRQGAYVVLWAAAGACVLAAMASSYGAMSTVAITATVSVVVALTALTAAGDAIHLQIDHGRAVETVSLLVAPVTIAITLLAPIEAALVVLVGVAASRAWRSDLAALSFDLGHLAVAVTTSSVAFGLAAAGAPLGSARWMVAGLLAAAVFVLVEQFAVTGLVAIAQGRSQVDVLNAASRRSAITLLGNASIGLLAPVAWTHNPALSLLLVVPGAVLFLAYRGVGVRDELVSRLDAQRERLERVLEVANDGVAILDLDGRVVSWSDRMGDLTGLEPSDLVGESMPLLQEIVDVASESIDTAGIHTLHERSGRVVRFMQRDLLDARGVPDGSVVTLSDVTAVHDLDQLKDELLSWISHELRTPLTPLIGFVELLRHDAEDMPPQMVEESYARILGHARRLEQIADEMVTVAELASELPFRPPVPVPVAAMSRQVAERWRDRQRKRTFTVDGADDVAVAADPRRLYRVLDAVVSNACNYSAVTEPVVIRIHAEDDDVTIEVQDRGRGIPRQCLDRIFDRFYRVEDPLTMQTRGLGLGLFIARRFVDGMKGSIEVTTTPEVGSCFSIRLPRAESVS